MPSKSTLLDIDDVDPRSSKDDACIAEVRQVLERHGSLHRFGLMLLHEHFPIGEDEVLVEESDADNRTLTIRPVKMNALTEAPVVETQWRLDTNAAMGRCIQICSKTPDGKKHLGTRYHIK